MRPQAKQSGPEHYVDFRMHRSSGSDPDVQHGSERWIRTKWNSKYRDGLFVGTNPTDELITPGLPVIRAQSDGSLHSPVPRR